ncbi:MAG: NAD/NADP octopine/nopaline dehydrogenase family protein [Armatimonadota bacterium]
MRVTVIGAGAGGQAAAAVMSRAGADVTLFSRSADRLEPVTTRGGVEITGDRGEGFAPIARTTTDVAVACQADVITVFTIANAHADVAALLAPHLRSDQAVVLASGSSGALEVARIWREGGLDSLPLLGETVTLPQSARVIGPAQVKIRLPTSPRTAAFPASRTDELLARLDGAFEVRRATNVLDTGLHNPNFIIHPAPMVLNYAAIERADGRLSLMNEGMTAGVLRAMDAHDGERMALLEAAGLRALSLDEIYDEHGSSPAVYRSPGEPMGLRDRIHFRYIDEDVPYGSVFMSSLGRLLGVPTPINDACNTLASVARGVDYWASGRTVERMGLAGLTRETLPRYLETGRR